MVYRMFYMFLDIPYEITVHTGDVGSAGTSANVFIVVYGSGVNTGECMLADTKKKKKGCFDRGSVDQFVKEVRWCKVEGYIIVVITQF